jgi:sporulation protein YlmC with PRC-barrel domain
MFIDNKNLIGLPVETKSGLLLGKIKSFEIESETQVVEKYIVKSRNLIGKLLREELGELVIGRNQVISIDEIRMVVEDGVVEEKEIIRMSQGVGKNIPALPSRLSLKTDGE